MIRKATAADIDAVEMIYSDIHDREEAGLSSAGWRRGFYPTREDATQALARGDLYVLDEGGEVLASAVVDQLQPAEYAQVEWAYPAAEDEVLVLNTLAVSPRHAGQGLGKRFVRWYENCAALQGCRCLRLGTGESNTRARRLYEALGYRQAGTVTCRFGGLGDLRSVYLEKRLGGDAPSYEKSCGAVVYRRERNNILILTEYMKKGHTSIPKGHIEQGETEEETALREIFEETGLSVTLDTGFRTVVNYSPREGVSKDVVFFTAEAAAGAVTEQKIEVTRAVFLPPEEAIRAMTYESDREIIRRACEYLCAMPSGRLRGRL